MFLPAGSRPLYDHVNEKLTEAGVTVNLVQCNDDAAMQVDQINTFIAQGVDAIIINPANPPGDCDFRP